VFGEHTLRWSDLPFHWLVTSLNELYLRGLPSCNLQRAGMYSSFSNILGSGNRQHCRKFWTNKSSSQVLADFHSQSAKSLEGLHRYSTALKICRMDVSWGNFDQIVVAIWSSRRQWTFSSLNTFDHFEIMQRYSSNLWWFGRYLVVLWSILVVCWWAVDHQSGWTDVC